MFTVQHPWVFAVGLLGNLISFMVFLAPLPTFIRIFKKKTTEGFQSLPYVAAIFSCMLWIYYAMLKGNDVLLETINTIGVVIEAIYIVVYITYAPKPARMFTVKLLLFFNFGAFSTTVLLCHYFLKGQTRLQVFGWICVAFSISVFAAPLSVIRTVIRTKSVKYMPFNLSFCLVLTATIWFFYGLLQKDVYITLPNVVGFLFGMAQMILYGIYRKYDKMAEKQKLPEKQPRIPSPGKKENITNTDSHCKNDDIMMPPQQAQDNEIELGQRDYQAQEENFHGLPMAQPCYVDADRTIAGGPSSASAAQLVQCAV
uniref:Bidirectional sugar transporter SWEET n=1 Tax=Opuntia streptacantha TaxID=393608 RepID=A0A7C9D8Y0_OPUST